MRPRAARGIARALQIVRNEIDMALAQIGCASFDALDARHLRDAGAETFASPSPPLPAMPAANGTAFDPPRAATSQP